MLLLPAVLGVMLTGMPVAGCAETVSPDYFGMHFHRPERVTSWPVAGAGSWRLWDARVQWAHLQPAKKAWRFDKLDRYVDMAAAHNVSVLLPLGLSPRWASARPHERSAYGEGLAAEPASMEDWRVYVSTVAQRYKGRVKAYEIWNEPNDKAFFSGSPEKLVELTCEAYRILKATDASITVVSPAYTGEKNIDKLDAFLAAGGAKCIDVVAYHLYVPSKPPEALPPLIKQIRQVMKQQGIGQFPLWNTESGWVMNNSDGTRSTKVPEYWRKIEPEQSASYVARAYLLGSAFGLSRFYWYAWDNGTFGLVEPSTKTLKPGAVALKVVAGWMVGSPPPTCVTTGGMWACTLSEGATERRVVVWSPDSASRYTAPAGWRISRAERADGKTDSVRDTGQSVLTDELPRLLILSADKPGTKP